MGAQQSILPIPKVKPQNISQESHKRIQYSLFDLRKAPSSSAITPKDTDNNLSSAWPPQKPSEAEREKYDIKITSTLPKDSSGYQSLRARTKTQKDAVKNLQQRVKHLIRNDQIALAHKTLKVSGAKSGLDLVEQDILQSRIAAAALYRGDVKTAYILAHNAAARSGLHVPMAGWIAGLSSWLNKNYEHAAKYFEITARSPYVSDWQAAAGSYWAARAYRELGNTREAKGWLEHAAKYQNTFYGLIALRTLDQPFVLTPKIKKSHPRPAWGTRTQFGIDPALVHAIALQESRFNTHAQSQSGARGLMQIMPATARHVAEKINVDLGDDLEHLFMPETNLKIGQAYLAELLEANPVRGDILSLLMAYNGGPGNLANWKSNWPTVHDPLLFIELIPLTETRKYVEKVLANYWIYRMRDNKPTPTLDSLAFSSKVEYADHSEHILLRVADNR